MQAQKRSETNDTVHLFEADEPSSLCEGSGRTSAMVTLKDDRSTFEVDLEEAYTEGYLTRDGEVVGQICGRCQQVLRMANRFDTEQFE